MNWLLWDLDLEGWLQASWLGNWAGKLQAWVGSSWLLHWLDPLCWLAAALYLVLASQADTGRLGLVLLGMAALLLVQWLVRPPQLTPIHLPLGLYWGIVTLATLCSPVLYAAVEGWMKLTLYVLGYGLLHQIVRRPGYRSALVGVALLVSLWMGIYGIRQFFYGAAELATWTDPESGLSGVTRVYSFLRNPNLYGGFLVPLIPLGLAAASYWRPWGLKLLALTTTLINATALLLSYSRGAWIGAVVASLTLGLLLFEWNSIRLSRWWRRWTIPLVLGGSAALLVLAVALIEPLRLRVLSFFAGRNDTSNNFRLNVWQSSLKMIRDFPLLGIGPGNDAFNRVYPLYQRDNYTALGAYSVPLELAVEAGIPGLLAYVWMVVVLLNQGWRSWRQLLAQREALWLAAGLAAVAGMITHGLVDTIWYRPQVQMLWWFSVALISSNLVRSPQARSSQDL